MNNFILKNIAKVYTGKCATAKSVSENQSIVVCGQRINWIGRASDIPAQYSSFESLNCAGLCVIPGLIDCHTHVTLDGISELELDKMNGAFAILFTLFIKEKKLKLNTELKKYGLEFFREERETDVLVISENKFYNQ